MIKTKLVRIDYKLYTKIKKIKKGDSFREKSEIASKRLKV
jgi:hypothetical protein